MLTFKKLFVMKLEDASLMILATPTEEIQPLLMEVHDLVKLPLLFLVI